MRAARAVRRSADTRFSVRGRRFGGPGREEADDVVRRGWGQHHRLDPCGHFGDRVDPGEHRLLVRPDRRVRVGGVGGESAASSAASSMAWLAPSPTGGMRCAASPMRVMPGRLAQRVPMGIASIVRGVGAPSPASMSAVRRGSQPPNMSSSARLLRYVSMGRSSARSEIPTRTLPSPRRCAARIWFTPTHHRFPGPTSSARSGWRRSTSLDGQLDEGGHVGQLRVGQQRPDDRARAVRADEDVAVGSVAAIERQLEAPVGSWRRRDEPVPPGHRVAGEGIEQKITQCAPVDLGTSGERAGLRLVVHEGPSGRVEDAMFLALGPRLATGTGRRDPPRPGPVARTPGAGRACRPAIARIGLPRARTPPHRCRAGAGSGPASARRGRHRRSRFASSSPLPYAVLRGYTVR